MSRLRISHHPILQASEPTETVSFQFDGRSYEGRRGEPIAAALLANEVRALRWHEQSGAPRGIYCAIGHCMECRVEVAGRGVVRACLTPLEEGLEIQPIRPFPNVIVEGGE